MFVWETIPRAPERHFHFSDRGATWCGSYGPRAGVHEGQMVDIGARLGCITLNLGRNLANLGHGNLLFVFCLICLATFLLLTVSTLQGGAGGSLRRQMIGGR